MIHHHTNNLLKYSLYASLALGFVSSGAAAQDGPASKPAADLAEASLEDLMNMEISSVSKKKERLSDAAAAVYVITNDDLRRSGVTNIPDALRMVPGISVARINSSAWAVTARGFNNQYTDKMLVLIDGRTVYSGIFSGVYWDEQDYPLQDVERIEVIRGPGGTLWGANAVNGVINIITKNAKDTRGGLLHAGGGSEDTGFGTFRYGGKIGKETYGRVYGKYNTHDNSKNLAGDNADDDWSAGRGGFRVDSNINERDSFTFQGDAYRGNFGESGSHLLLAPPFAVPFDDNVKTAGGNLLARFTHAESANSEFQVQTYFDNRVRRDRSFDLEENTFDADFQHRMAILPGHDFLWGMNFRWKDTQVEGTRELIFDPDHRSTGLVSAFAQDTIHVIDKQLKLILGSKFEYNDLSGFEIQPNARAAWEINDRNTVWAAVSRAVRTPSLVDFDLKLDFLTFPAGAGVGEARILGNPRMKSEELIAYELGYRVKPADELFLDAAGFVNSYENLRSGETRPTFIELTPAPPHAVVPTVFENRLHGIAYGGELSATWVPKDGLRFAAAYSYINIDLKRSPSSNDTAGEVTEGSTPRNQLHLRSFINVSKTVELDTLLNYVERLPDLGVRGYVRLDARVGWKPKDNIEFSFGLQNIIDTTHREFGNPTIENPTLLERAVVASVTIRF